MDIYSFRERERETEKNEENTVKCLMLRVKEVAKTIAKSTN